MKRGRSLIKETTTFFATGLWELNPDAYRGIRRHAVKYLQITVLVFKDFRADQCLIRASALAFTTILSLVPFFALAFAVLKGFGVQNKVEPFILDQVAAGSQEIVDRIVTYINNTNMTSLGAIGLLALIITVIALLGNIEEAFNLIWGVRETRSLYRKFSDYLSVLVSAPLLMLAAMSFTATLQSRTFVQWVTTNTYLGDELLLVIRLLQHASVWAALVFLYVFIPNTKVRFKSALIGGILAGTLWQCVQWVYIHFQVGVAKYNAIYGTLAGLPIFMVWIYTSWLIVLFGMELVCAHQNIRNFRREFRLSINHGLKELFVLAILQAVAEAFHFGTPPLSVEELAEKLDIPVRICRELLELLTDSGYLVKTAGEAPYYQPAYELENITIKDVLDTLKNFGGDCKIGIMSSGEKVSQEILARIDASSSAALSGMTLKDLVGTPPKQKAEPAGSAR
jgi:membrane protein